MSGAPVSSARAIQPHGAGAPGAGAPGAWAARIAALITAVGLTVLLAWLVASAHERRQPSFVELGLAQATARADGSVVLAIDLTNASGRPLDGNLRVTAEGGRGTGVRTLAAGRVEAPTGTRGPITLTVAGGCGRRLIIALEADPVTRSLDVLAPCPVGASAP